MLIRSIRLQNIKSFGSGADGQGVRVAFERGLNRLAGPNGAGKSTLIEALGYALFDHSPETHARMDLDTLLLRSSAKEGEIEVEIETEDGRHLVKRGVGKQSKTRWTVRDASGFITHETEDEVRRFLAAAAGLPAPEGLPDLFRKLVGVRQGRMLDPFELTPTEARKHFAPILDVEIYQHCFADLLEPARILEREVHEEVRKRDVARAQAEMLSSAPQEAETLSTRLVEMEGELHAARHALAKAREDLAVHETRERAIPEAKSALEATRKAVENADKSLVEKREWLQRAEQARKVLETHAEAHRAYLASQDVFTALTNERKQYEGARERAAGLKQQLAAAQAKAQESDRQARAQQGEIEKRAAENGKRKEAYEQRKSAFEKAQAGASSPEAPETLRQARESLNGAERWAAGLQAALEGARQAGKDAADANRKLANFDPQVVQRANAARDAARSAHDAKKTEHTELEARRKSRREMSHVLEQSKHCPMMAERCKQFDAGKLVLSEVQLDETLDDLRKETAAAEAALKKAEAAAEAAQRELDGTRDIRVTADRALKELGRHLEFARQPDSVEAWKAAAAAFVPAGGKPLELPDLLELPHPGMDPWKALEAAAAVAASFCAFAESVNASVEKWSSRLDERQQASQDRSRKREQEAHELSVEAKRLLELEDEFVKARKAHDLASTRTQEALATAESLALSLEDLNKRVAALDSLEARATEAEAKRAAFSDGHRAYVAAEADAARLEQTRGDVAVAVGDLERARASATAAFQARDKAIAAYDAPGHARARKALEETAGQVMAMERDLIRDREQLEEAQRRVKQLQQARDGWNHSEARRALLDARRELLEHARRTLRDAGPKVAEHLVQAVNGRAQRIFSALSPNDPGQLDWQSDYELRVATSNGVRRFSMLSGGQKVKAALAIQLALIQQFSQAGLCVFDEPTYALDAESRGLLAEAIADAQSLTKFEQLFVVSHDDAFDGHVEHTIVLAYSPANGSSVS